VKEPEPPEPNPLEERVRELEEHDTERNASLAANAAVIEALEEELVRKDEALAEMSRKLDEARTLNQASSDEVSQLQADLRARDETIGDLRLEIDELESAREERVAATVGIPDFPESTPTPPKRGKTKTDE
jgi:chromosome segregation ATPase